MANTYTYADIQGKGLKIPETGFINSTDSGKLEKLYMYDGNAQTLYTSKETTYQKGILTDRLDYKDPIVGQGSKSAFDDAAFITKFLGTSQGIKFLTRQFLLQGLQVFDETKLYNPASPILAAAMHGLYGLVDAPTRHIDTSNVVGGVLSGLGVSGLVSTAGSLITGDSESNPAPPRSSVASGASSGFGLSTLTSLVGGADRSNEVVAPIARDSVQGLLRGGTATSAYLSRRYQRLVPSEGSSFLGRILSSALSFVVSNTAIGTFVNPTQPWEAKYRADEKTYDYYLKSGGLLNFNTVDSAGSSILNSIKNALGFGKASNYSSAVPQRFFGNLSDSSLFPTMTRFLDINFKRASQYDTDKETSIGSGAGRSGFTIKPNINLSSNTIILSGNEDEVEFKTFVKDNGLKYTDVIRRGNVNSTEGQEVSDQLYAYYNYSVRDYNINTVFRQKGVLPINRYSNSDTKFQYVDVEKLKKDFYTKDGLGNAPSQELKSYVKLIDNKYEINDQEKFSSLEKTYNSTFNSPYLYNRIDPVIWLSGHEFESDDIESLHTKEDLNLETTFKKTTDNLSLNYEIDTKVLKNTQLRPLQFVKFGINNIEKGGHQYINGIEKGKSVTYLEAINSKKIDGIGILEKNKIIIPPLVDSDGKSFIIDNNNIGENKRAIAPTHLNDYVNSLSPSKYDNFKETYLSAANGYGPDYIKFFFYDIVNQIYIPFAATITGLADTNNTTWTDVSYIGRADTLYHYTGFKRNVAFEFKTIAHSVYELLPMWQRINYLVGLTRPANYTDLSRGGMIVPPMVQLTMGDFYKNHFVIIDQIIVKIPEDASWELVPEDKCKNWAYGVANVIKPKDKDIVVAQVPIMADISIRLRVLEKDRPRTGHGIWGDAPAIYENITTSEEKKENRSVYFDSDMYGDRARMDYNQSHTITSEIDFGNSGLLHEYPDREFSNNIRYNTNNLSVEKVIQNKKTNLASYTYNTRGNLVSSTYGEYEVKDTSVIDKNGIVTSVTREPVSEYVSPLQLLPEESELLMR